MASDDLLIWGAYLYIGAKNVWFTLVGFDPEERLCRSSKLDVLHGMGFKSVWAALQSLGPTSGHFVQR